jgi:hypothetical protein
MRDPSKPFIGFREYIQKRRITDTRQGDFTAVAKRDPNLPNAKSWRELEDYFYNHHMLMADGVLVSARLVWRQYRSLYPARLEKLLR